MFMSYLLYIRLGCHLCADAAALLVAADLVGANLPGGLQLPVGVTAGLLGGAYLLLLLNGQERKR